MGGRGGLTTINSLARTCAQLPTIREHARTCRGAAENYNIMTAVYCCYV